MRGLFTAGVLDVLLEEQIVFDCCAGVSAGAAFGCNYKSGQAGRVLRYNLAYCRDPRYCGLRSLFFTGDLFGAEFCYHTLPEILDPFDKDAFDRSPIEFYAVSTDTATGKPVYHCCERADESMEWIRASASIPVVSRPVEIGGLRLLDGGVSDSIPLRFMIDRGCRKNLVVLTRPRDYLKKDASYRWTKPFLKREPGIPPALKARAAAYNETRSFVFAEEQKQNAVVICPDRELEIRQVEHDPERIRSAYFRGRAAAKEKLSQIQKLLSE